MTSLLLRDGCGPHRFRRLRRADLGDVLTRPPAPSCGRRGQLHSVEGPPQPSWRHIGRQPSLPDTLQRPRGPVGDATKSLTFWPPPGLCLLEHPPSFPRDERRCPPRSRHLLRPCRLLCSQSPSGPCRVHPVRDTTLPPYCSLRLTPAPPLHHHPLIPTSTACYDSHPLSHSLLDSSIGLPGRCASPGYNVRGFDARAQGAHSSAAASSHALPYWRTR